MHRIPIGGIRCFPDLTSRDDRNLLRRALAPYRDMALKLARARGMKVSCHWKPVTDMDVRTRKGMREVLDVIDAPIRADLPVFVHHPGGIGRTGTGVMCWLARHGIAGGEAALDTVEMLRRGDSHADIASPQTAQQRRFVRGWNAGD